MIVCHCNVLTETDLSEAVDGMLRDDPWQLIVPGKLYRELGKRGKCCRCFPNVVDIIVRTTENFHRRMSLVPEDAEGYRRQLDDMKKRYAAAWRDCA